MTIALLIVLPVAVILGVATGWGIAYWGMRQREQAIFDFSRDALELVRATSLDEKVAVDLRRKQYDIQVEQLRDATVQEVQEIKKQRLVRPVKLENGETLDLNEWEPI